MNKSRFHSWPNLPIKILIKIKWLELRPKQSASLLLPYVLGQRQIGRFFPVDTPVSIQAIFDIVRLVLVWGDGSGQWA